MHVSMTLSDVHRFGTQSYPSLCGNTDLQWHSTSDIFGPSNSRFQTPLMIMDFLQVPTSFLWLRAPKLLQYRISFWKSPQTPNKTGLGEFKVPVLDDINLHFVGLISLNLWWSYIISQKCLGWISGIHCGFGSGLPTATDPGGSSKPPCSSGCRRESPLDLGRDFLKPGAFPWWVGILMAETCKLT